MTDQPALPRPDDVIDSYFVQTSLYDHPDDVAGSPLMHELAQFDLPCDNVKNEERRPQGKQVK